MHSNSWNSDSHVKSVNSRTWLLRVRLGGEAHHEVTRMGPMPQHSV